MTPEAVRLFQHLADGAPINGDRYAAAAGLGRAALSKQVEQLRAAGLPVAAAPGAEYRLAWPVELLDAAEIRRAGKLGDVGVEVAPLLDSTNLALAARFRHRHALAAEYQTGGRGRRGRGWISPPGCGICVSFGYRFEAGLRRLGPLSLVAGVVVAETVADEGVAVGLKWPNDLVVEDRKLGGVLTEIRGAGEGPCNIVIGIGINVRLPRADEVPDGCLPPDQPWIDLHAAGVQPPCRNRLAGRMIAALDAGCREFEHAGFEPFASRWAALDALRGRPVRVWNDQDQAFEGIAEGVTRGGTLRVARQGEIAELDAGEVSVRAR
ncbi:MAG: biotin--[acetyl-CoA-carboxylase] ligase [Wenzhouxiangellaceae bacterium]